MRSEHRALIDKVEAFTSVAFARRRDDMACAAGCSSCCQVSLTVTGVEAAAIRIGLAALSTEERARIRERAKSETESSACVMLDPTGRCTVYEHRPLVCRTQGHALRYPAGFIPEAAVRARGSKGDVTHCPLNFTLSAPNDEDVLDAERVDQILSIVARRFAVAHGLEPSARFALSALATESDDAPNTAQSSRPGANR